MSTPDEFGLYRLGIGPDDAGGRLDRVVGGWRGLSRAAVLRLIEAGALGLNGRAVRNKDKGRVLGEGDVLELDPSYAGDEAPMADASLALDVLAQGEGWAAVNKPAGVAVRPHALGERGTLLNAVVARWPGVVGVGEGGLRSGVVHRLDVDTSGVIVFATTQACWLALRDAFAGHHTNKRYAALVHGTPPSQGEAVEHLRVAGHSPARVQVHGRDEPALQTRACSLAWRVTRVLTGGVSLVEVDLHTGFLHQIRVMFSHMGHPVLGDKVYGTDRPSMGVTRQMLHASRLAFDDTVIEAPLPDDFEQAIKRFTDQ